MRRRPSDAELPETAIISALAINAFGGLPAPCFVSSGLTLYRRLLSQVRPYWWAFAAAIVGMLVVAAGDVVMAYMVMPIVRNFQKPDPAMTVRLPLAIVAVFLLRGLGSYASEYGMAWTGHRVVFDLRCRMIDRLLSLPTSYFDAQAPGRLISKFTFDAYQLAAASSSAITTAIRSSFTIAGSLGLLLWLNWKVTLVASIVLPTVGAVLRYFNRRLRRFARDVQQRTGSITHVLEEILGSHRVVKIFGGQAYERRRAVAGANQLRTSMSKEAASNAASGPILQFVAATAVGVMVYIALRQAEVGALQGDRFVAYVVALLTLIDRLRSLSGVNGNIQRGLAAAESVFGMIDQSQEEDRGKVELTKVRGELRFERVSLRYGANEKNALAEVSLTVAPGEALALVGPSGAGKTSLVNLVPRFYQPTSGRILLDGHDIDELSLANLRSQIALVSQDVILFNDTVAANIAYGVMANASRAEVQRAAAAAHALEFVRALPEGFDTVVGENGVRLSGGQRQRLAIARAILKNAPILILDEATSALDSESERHVQAAMDTLMRGRTTIVIAHRLSTIERVDRIAVLDAGRVVELGTHAELLARGGLYAKLHRIQFATAPAVA
jgi:ATP-binding cassette, subfamily B, bacterial MsbA